MTYGTTSYGTGEYGGTATFASLFPGLVSPTEKSGRTAPSERMGLSTPTEKVGVD